MMDPGMMGYGFFGWLIVAVIVIVPFWKICTKAGYPGGISLLMLIPLANLVFLYFLAFSEWPSLKQSGSTH